MKINFLLLLMFSILLVSCEPDTDNEPQPNNAPIDFIGTWDRDSVLLNEITSGGNATRIESEANVGWYKFNAGNTGILHLNTGDYAINWNYTQSSNTILISEIDWINQTYTITKFNDKEIKLVGRRNAGGGITEERIMYLGKR